MSRRLSTEERTAHLTAKLRSPHLGIHQRIEWQHDDFSWSVLDEVDGEASTTLRFSAKRLKYANYQLTPVASDISFSVQNRGGKFSPKSGLAESDILRKNRKIRVGYGFRVPEDDEVEFVNVGEFLLDDPVFVEPPEPRMATVRCGGRSIWKKAIETDVNTPVGNESLANLARKIAERVGIGVGVIKDLPIDPREVEGYGDTVKAEKIFEDIMTVLQDKEINLRGYQMWIDDESKLNVTPKPQDLDAGFVLDFRNYIQGDFSFSSDRQLQRLTVASKLPSVGAEIKLREVIDVGTLDETLSWNQGSAMFKRVEFSTSPEGAFELIDVAMSNTFVVLTVKQAQTGVGTWSAAVFGSVVDSPPKSMGEAVNVNNMLKREGTTAKIENPLIVDDDEAKRIAEGFISDFGDPAFSGRVDYPYLNPLIQINDQALIWSRFFFEDNLYVVTGIEYQFTAESATSSFTLEDSGHTFTDEGDIVYDRDPSISYDKGFLYDMAFGPQADPADVDEAIYTKDILAG